MKAFLVVVIAEFIFLLL